MSDSVFDMYVETVLRESRVIREHIGQVVQSKCWWCVKGKRL